MSTGLAISGTSIAAARAGDGGVWQRPLAIAEGTSWPSLAAALQEGVASGTISSPVRIALLPPLVEVRSVSIPPVGEEDAKRLLARAASRHFTYASEAMTVGVGTLATGSAAGATRLAAAVPTRLLRAIHDAARENALVIDVVVPAHAALSIEAPGPRSGDKNTPLVATFDDALALIIRQHATPVSVRRFRREGDDAALAEALAGLGAPRRIDDPLVSCARALATPAGASATRTDWPLALGGATERDPRSATPGPRSWWFLAGAAAFAVGTVFMQELDARRELDAIRTQRSALAPALRSLPPAFAGGNAGGGAVIAELRSGPRWSRVLADLSDVLPPAVFITHLRGRADTVVVEGNAVQASAAYDALAAAPWVRSIEATAPVRRETADDGSVAEKFEFTLTLRGAR